MSTLAFRNSEGKYVEVGPDNPLPVSGAGGGGMLPEDITASAPATWDAETQTIGVTLGTSSTTAAAGNHTHSQYATTTALTNGLATKQDAGDYATTTDLTNGLAGKANTSHTHSIAQVTDLQTELAAKLTASQGAAVADSTAEDVATLVADFNSLLASLRAAGIIAV